MAMQPIKRKYKYTCYYRLFGEDMKNCPAPDSRQGMLSFMHGFWVDAKGNLVEDIVMREEDLTWVPPHQIDRIERTLIKDDLYDQ